VQPLTAVKP